MNEHKILSFFLSEELRNRLNELEYGPGKFIKLFKSQETLDLFLKSGHVLLIVDCPFHGKACKSTLLDSKTHTKLVFGSL